MAVLVVGPAAAIVVAVAAAIAVAATPVSASADARLNPAGGHESSLIGPAGIDSRLAARPRSATSVEPFTVDGAMALSYSIGSRRGPTFPWVELLGNETSGYFALAKGDTLDPPSRERDQLGPDRVP